MVASVILSVGSTLHRERAMREEYSFRLPPQCQGYLNRGPRSSDTGILYSAFTLNGYKLVTQDASGARCNSSVDAPYDELSFTSGFGHVWVERASKLRSQIVDMQEPSRVAVNGARDPMLSSDGQDLAFVRDDHGRGQLMVRKAFQSSAWADVSLTPSSLNVYEASFRTENEY